MKNKRVYDLYGLSWGILRTFMMLGGAIFASGDHYEESAVAFACVTLSFYVPMIRQGLMPMPGDPGHEDT